MFTGLTCTKAGCKRDALRGYDANGSERLQLGGKRCAGNWLAASGGSETERAIRDPREL